MKTLINYLLAGTLGLFLNTAIAEELPPDPPGRCPYADMEDEEEIEEKADGFCYAFNRMMAENRFDIRFTYKTDGMILLVNNMENCICEICFKANKEMNIMMCERWYEATNSKQVQLWSKNNVLLMYTDIEGNFIKACEIF